MSELDKIFKKLDSILYLSHLALTSGLSPILS